MTSMGEALANYRKGNPPKPKPKAEAEVEAPKPKKRKRISK